MKWVTRGPALTTLIATLFALVAATTLAVAGLVLDRALGRQIAEQQERELIGTVEQVRHQLSERTSVAEIRANAHVFRDLIIGQGAVYFSLWERPGNPLFTTGPLLPFADEGVINERDRPQLKDVRSQMVDGMGRLRILRARGELGDRRGTTVLIVLGRPDDRVVSALQGRYRATLVPAILLAALAAATLGFGVVWWSLRPLAALARKSAQLTAHRLDERLDERHGSREVRELSAALNGLMHRLAESFERLSQFSADLAHELKTPLATLMVQTQVALSQPRCNEDYRILLASNAEEIERLSNMIESMLFLARADHAQLALRPELVDVGGELVRIADYFDGPAEQANAKIVVAGAGRARADPVLLRRAVANLVDNAIRYVRPGSTIRLDVSESASATVIAVSNDGAGIAFEDLPRIFDRFYRADGTRGGARSSVGLGLAIVKSIMELHGGSVEVQSVPEASTEFRLLFRRTVTRQGAHGGISAATKQPFASDSPP